MFSQRVQWSRRLFVNSVHGLFADLCIDLGEDLVNVCSERNSSEAQCMYHGNVQRQIFVTTCDTCLLALLFVCLSKGACYLGCLPDCLLVYLINVRLCSACNNTTQKNIIRN